MTLWAMVNATLGMANLGVAAVQFMAGDYGDAWPRLNIAGLFGLVAIQCIVIRDLKRQP
jgi:hypothetical protein